MVPMLLGKKCKNLVLNTRAKGDREKETKTL